VHEASLQEAVEADARTRMVDVHSKMFVKAQSARQVTLVRGATVRVVPELSNCQVDPAEATIEWRGGFQSTLFSVQPLAMPTDDATTIQGRICYYVGPVPLAAVVVQALAAGGCKDHGRHPVIPVVEVPYQAIFVSYAHDDAALVDWLEEAYQGLGMDY